jgi:hypothetical protein
VKTKKAAPRPSRTPSRKDTPQKKPTTKKPAPAAARATNKPAAKKPAPKKAAPPVPAPPPVAQPAGDYAAYRDRQAAISRARSVKGREIGPLPEVVDPERKARCLASSLEFDRTYFPRRFRLAFSSSHHTAIDRMESCTDHGGLFACAMPRGSGKTTLAECEAIRAVLKGKRRFVVILCATSALAKRRLKQIVRELENNDLLAEDFPEACFPIRCLNRIHNRARGQTLNGEPTRIEMTAEGIILPTVPGAACSGAVIQVASMEGAIRGLNVSAPDGEPLRPDMVLIDDAQTKESAKSLLQTADRESVIVDDVLGLAGPDVTIAAMMLCTVIYPNDLSDRFLSDELHPEWQGVRTKMLEAFPERMDLWDEYAEVRREGQRYRDRGKRANEFLRERWDDMHRGAVVSWPERKEKGELSGVQCAMNKYITNRRGFLAEFQNTPEADTGPTTGKELLPAEVVKRLAGTDRCAVPREATRVTAMFDCGGLLHWYAVCAWNPRFGGALIDYGAWPRQSRTVFAAADPRPGLADAHPTFSESERVYAGLEALAEAVLGREYVREGTGERLTVGRCLVDCGWESKTVYTWCRQTKHRGIVYPSKGIGRTTTARGVSEWKPRPGEEAGWHWRLTMSETGKGRMVQFDPDAWKTFIWERLTTPMGGAGCLVLYGTDGAAHELLGAHLAAEQSEPVTLRGQTFDKWQVRPHRPDNHLLDVVVGCAVAAAVQGLNFDSGLASGANPPPKRPKKQIDIEELYRKANPDEVW